MSLPCGVTILEAKEAPLWLASCSQKTTTNGVLQPALTRPGEFLRGLVASKQRRGCHYCIGADKGATSGRRVGLTEKKPTPGHLSSAPSKFSTHFKLALCEGVKQGKSLGQPYDNQQKRAGSGPPFYYFASSPRRWRNRERWPLE
ncbi:hypothetical protein L915_21465 [Phytophthora nicotianae]|uniref:Uncharacterized protein n=2 Tax=Phytophthora nicotianae TaxID=4792 RepID=V9DVH5_PHYNI|nr:hypothetical protein F443_22057 [Phytophthora nicotianae P1569]ETK71277.1 hypothetical protein L915_21465 [Phytophthora nicotianae]ETL24705.1 hypothetical protein L916_21329 [Phytophthora nicotianae]